MTPQELLRHHVTGAIERGEKEAIVEQPAPKLYLRTPYGEQYHIYENGDIQRLDLYPSNKPFTPSGQWKLLGVQHVKRNKFIPLARLITQLPDDLNGSSIRYNNGKPQWTVRDLDHGTIRVWGNTQYHGIAEIRRLN